MKRKFTSFVVLCAFTFAAVAQNQRNTAAYFSMSENVTASDYLANTIVFKVKPEFRSVCRITGVENDKLNAIFNSLNTASVAKIFPRHTAPAQERNAQGQNLVDLSLIYKLEYSGSANLVKTINQIISTGMVEYAEPFYVPHLNYNPNDPSTALQYALTKINAYNAWDVSHGDTNVVIGIVDTGTDWDHPDLAGNLKLNYADPINGLDDDGDGYIDNYRGWDIADNDNNPIVDGGGGTQGHGSHVSGCAAAVTDNNTGVASPGFNCKFLPVKASKASDPNTYLVGGYPGIIYAADHGCSIINCSWGGGGEGGQFGQDAITYASINHNCLVVVSAGNNSNEVIQYPAGYQYALAVASTTNTDAKSSFSSYGGFVDVCAPGTNIYSTFYNNTYTYLSGTSMASPITAGAAALVKSQFPTYTGLQVGEQLRITCDNIDGVTGNGSFAFKLGRGRINLYNALTQTTSPSVRFLNKVTTDNNDNTIVIGDTMRISGDFVNYLAPTANLVVTMSTTSPFVTILDNTHSIGVLNTLATDNNSADPFTVKVNAGTPLNTKITFKLTFTDGAYSDFYSFDETVNVDYINITINDVLTTITSKGRLCWNATAQTEGLGFNYLGNQLNYEAGLMIGNNSNVSDNVRAGGATPDNDFQSTLLVQKTIPSVKSEFDLYGIFNDNPAAAPLKTLVTHKAYAWSTPGNRKFVIVEYNIKNNGTSPLTSLYAGIFSDWDVMNYALNKGAQDNATKMGYVYSTEVNGLYAGIKLLTQGPFLHYAIDNVAGGGGGIDMVTDYTSAEKYTTLSTNRANAGGAGTGNDVCDVVSTGPFSLNVGDSVIVAFALIAGDSLSDLITSAENAQIKYDEPLSVTENAAVGNEINLGVYPNPAKENLSFSFVLETPAKASLNIYNSLGEQVYHAADKNFAIGKQHITVNTQNLDNGIYFYELNVGGKSYKQKFTVLK